MAPVDTVEDLVQAMTSLEVVLVGSHHFHHLGTQDFLHLVEEHTHREQCTDM